MAPHQEANSDMGANSDNARICFDFLHNNCTLNVLRTASMRYTEHTIS